MLVKPHQCALAIAIPLERDEFLAEINAGIHKDFAQSLARQHPALKEDILWEEIYAPIVETVKLVAQAAQAKNVEVVTRATLSNLQELFQKFPVVTLVTHWRSSTFYPSDFIAPTQLIKILEQRSNPLIQTLVGAFPNNWIPQLLALESQFSEPRILSKTLAQDFNNVLKSCRLYPNPAPNQVRQVAPYDETYHTYLNRLAIDTTFKGFISPGNRIEFFDQFHSIEEVVTTIPENYDGLLDFTVCNSVLLGNLIKRHRQCIVLINEKPTSLAFRMVVYKGILELISRTDMSYMEATAAIRRKLLS